MRFFSQSANSIVAIHGTASVGSQWQSLSEAMAPEYTVLRPDLPGYGLAFANGIRANSTMAAEASHVARLISLHSDGPIHVVGHSFGGAVALKLAMTQPDMIASLTLIEPAVFHILRAQGSQDDRNAYREIQDLWRTLGSDGMQSFVDYWNGVGTWQQLKPTLQVRLSDQVESAGRNFQAALAENWSVEACTQITCPTLVIRGRASRRPALRASVLIADAIPGARVEEIAGAGHMAPITHADVTNQMIGEHIVSIDQCTKENSSKAA
ncbi:MAG: alpha/beta hydrolase [Pseudomonadota bacterium]